MAVAPWGTWAPRGFNAFILRCCHALPGTHRFAYNLIRTLRGPVKRGAIKPFDVRVLDMELRLLTRGNFCETTALFAPQFYDTAELDWLAEQLSGGGTFLDIGGNIGLYSLVMGRRLGDRIKVFTVEPDAELSARMMFNARQNGLNIHLMPVALSDFEGSATLVIDAYQRGQNSLKDDQRAEGASQREVPVTTLLALCEAQGITQVRAMKIDVEGHEPRILGHFFAHAPTSLWPEALLIEYVHDHDEIVTRLTGEFGYRIAGRTARNAMLLRS